MSNNDTLVVQDLHVAENMNNKWIHVCDFSSKTLSLYLMDAAVLNNGILQRIEKHIKQNNGSLITCMINDLARDRELVGACMRSGTKHESEHYRVFAKIKVRKNKLTLSGIHIELKRKGVPVK